MAKFWQIAFWRIKREPVDIEVLRKKRWATYEAVPNNNSSIALTASTCVSMHVITYIPNFPFLTKQQQNLQSDIVHGLEATLKE